MRRGDLASTPVPVVLEKLADERATGCLKILSPGGEAALVYLRDGLVCSVSMPGTLPRLGTRLVMCGALNNEQLNEALEAQRTELAHWRLGELLVHLGFVEQDVVEAVAAEQLWESCGELLRWQAGRWRFLEGRQTRRDAAPMTTVAALLEAVARREQELAELSALVGGPQVVPRLPSGGVAGAAEVSADATALRSMVDGERSVEELARVCGFTVYEATHLVAELVRSGLLEVDQPMIEPVADTAAEVVPVEPEVVPIEAEREAEPERELEPEPEAEPEPVPTRTIEVTEEMDEWAEEQRRRAALFAELDAGVITPSPTPEPDMVPAVAESEVDTEPEPAAVESDATPEPVAGADPAPEPVAGPDPAPEPVAGPDPAPEPAAVEPEPPLADTAALLRELSALGDNEPSPAPAPPLAARRHAATPPDKKRRAFFGR